MLFIFRKFLTYSFLREAGEFHNSQQRGKAFSARLSTSTCNSSSSKMFLCVIALMYSLWSSKFSSSSDLSVELKNSLATVFTKWLFSPICIADVFAASKHKSLSIFIESLEKVSKSSNQGASFIGIDSKNSNSLLKNSFCKRSSLIFAWYSVTLSLVVLMYRAVSLKIPDLDSFLSSKSRDGTEFRRHSKHPRITPLRFCSKALWCALRPDIFLVFDFACSLPSFFSSLLFWFSENQTSIAQLVQWKFWMHCLHGMWYLPWK